MNNNDKIKQSITMHFINILWFNIIDNNNTIIK